MLLRKVVSFELEFFIGLLTDQVFDIADQVSFSSINEQSISLYFTIPDLAHECDHFIL